MTTLTADSPLGLLELSDERDVQLELRLRAFREGYLEGSRDQWSAGYAAAIGDVKAAEHEITARLRVERSPWHVCCGRCRRNGHRNGCTRCQDRTRATFGDPHPDDYEAGAA
jgi:hypothetical protein